MELKLELGVHAMKTGSVTDSTTRIETFLKDILPGLCSAIKRNFSHFSKCICYIPNKTCKNIVRVKKKQLTFNASANISVKHYYPDRSSFDL